MTKQSDVDSEKEEKCKEASVEDVKNEAEDEGQKKDKKASKIIKITKEEHDRLVKEAAEYKDKHVRLYAEFDNARKRMDREKIEFVKYANAELIVEFLDVLDNLERSIDALKKKTQDDESVLKGMEMVMGQLYEMLKKYGVKPIETKGQMFNHDYHEVLMQEETDEHEDGYILEEFQKGYYLGDKVVRTAKVKVAKKK